MVGRTGKAVLSPNEYEDALVVDDPLSAESWRLIFAIAISLCFSLSVQEQCLWSNVFSRLAGCRHWPKWKARLRQ